MQKQINGHLAKFDTRMENFRAVACYWRDRHRQDRKCMWGGGGFTEGFSSCQWLLWCLLYCCVGPGGVCVCVCVKKWDRRERSSPLWGHSSVRKCGSSTAGKDAHSQEDLKHSNRLGTHEKKVKTLKDKNKMTAVFDSRLQGTHPLTTNQVLVKQPRNRNTTSFCPACRFRLRTATFFLEGGHNQLFASHTMPPADLSLGCTPNGSPLGGIHLPPPPRRRSSHQQQ